MTKAYRVATDEEKKDLGWCKDYDVLIGPDDFQCGLTEPEDRIWYRDGRKVIEELNRLHDELTILREQF